MARWPDNQIIQDRIKEASLYNKCCIRILIVLLSLLEYWHQAEVSAHVSGFHN